MKTLLAVDGNSLVHRAFHTRPGGGVRAPAADRGWAVRGLLRQVCMAVQRVGADRVVIGFDDPGSNLRRETFPGYKAHRTQKAEGLPEQLSLAVEVCAELGFVTVVPPGLEADDVLASAAAWGREQGVGTVLVTSDRDSFALIDDNTRVLRIINGGVDNSPVLTAARLPLLVGVAPHQYPDLAALRGDPSDNLPGVAGVGPKTGARLLAEFGCAAAVFDAAREGRCAGVVGPALARRLGEPQARHVWEHNRQVMAMRTDIPLGLDTDTGWLPFQEARVRQVFTRFELPVRPAAQALCGAAEDRAPVVAPVVPGPDRLPPARGASRRHPPLHRPAPDPPLTLF